MNHTKIPGRVPSSYERRAANVIVPFGVFGERGSHSEQAALEYAVRERARLNLRYYDDPHELLQALQDGEIQRGILPVMNTRGGWVQASFEAMGRYRFRVRGQVNLSIQHALLVKSAAVDLRAVKKVASHPQALVQCARFLQQELPRRGWVEYKDTASAARDLAQGRLSPQIAVVASERAGELYGLHPLVKNIQGAEDNRTTFVVFGRAIG